MDARVDFDPLLEAFGVPATVTRPAPDNTPIETVGIWLLPQFMDEPMGGSGFTRREPLRVFVLSKDAVPTLPTGTVIDAAERADGPVMSWQVDGIDQSDPDHTRVRVIRAREYDT